MKFQLYNGHLGSTNLHLFEGTVTQDGLIQGIISWTLCPTQELVHQNDMKNEFGLGVQNKLVIFQREEEEVVLLN